MLAGLLLRREPLFRGRDNADQLLKIVLVLGTVDLRLYLEKLGIPAPSWLDGTAAENDAEGVGSAPLPSGRISDWTSLRRNHHHHRRTGAADQDGGDVRQVPPDGIDLLCRLLVYDHSLRYTAQQALEHPFFDPVRRRVLAEVEAQRHADGRLIRGRRRGQEQRDRPPGGNAPSDLSFLSAPPPRSYDHHHQ
jgi:casein kinase II subunit alpha